MNPTRRGLPVVLAALAAGGVCRAQDDALPLYTGEQVCLECHAADLPGHECWLDPVPEHRHTYEALTSPLAKHVAALCGVGESPQESRICLGCHATGADAGPRWAAETFNIADGVQCEACHGAGSLHVEARRRPDANRGPGVLDRMHLPLRSECNGCHRELSSHRLVLSSGYRKPKVDALYRNPINLAVSPDGKRLYVVCENGNCLLVVDPGSGSVLNEIAVGRKPHDVSVSPDGKRLYVSNRFSDSLSVIDAAAGKVIAQVAVGDEPHGVVTDAEGRFVYVANTQKRNISVIDARELTEVNRLAAGQAPWSLALRPDGKLVCATNVRPQRAEFREPHHSEVTVIGTGRDGVVIDRPVAPEANSLEGIAYVPGRDVALFTLLRTKNLVPITRLAQGWTITNGLGILWPDGRVDQVLLDEPAGYFADPMDVAVSPDGRRALVTSGGTDRVAVVDVDALLATVTAAPDDARREVLPNHLGTSRRFVLKRIAVGSNPRGVVFSPDGRFAYVANALSDSVTVIETAGFTRARDIDLGGPHEISETRWGEKVFHSADISFGRQFSCRTCHPDGHLDGLTFDIEADGVGTHPVDNRTLRGILDTAPFKWEGHNPTLSWQCGPRLAVFFTRLAPYTSKDLAALVRYISTIEAPPNPHRRPEGLTPAQRRGKIVYERTLTNDGRLIRPELRCNTCHNSPYGTDATLTDVGSTMYFDAPIETIAVDVADLDRYIEELGEYGSYYYTDTGARQQVFDTPHLTNIYDSPPYMHNGTAFTLEEIWTRFDQLTLHGVTDDLTRQQFNDLIAYLKAF
jgi:YVTN family beta-propeller protein